MCRQCIYCDEPVVGEPGINYGGEVMHATCYVKFNDEMVTMYPEVEPPVDFDLVPELVEAAFAGLVAMPDDELDAWVDGWQQFIGHEGYEDDHVEADAVLA